MRKYISNRYVNARFIAYLRTEGLRSLETITADKITNIFLTACDDFFSGEISVAAFSSICEVLLIPSFETNSGALENILCLAADLIYDYKNDRPHFFVPLAEVMQFYLDHKNFTVSQN